MTAQVQALRLGKPVLYRGSFIRQLRMRAPTQSDFDEAHALSETAHGRGIALISIICNLDPMRQPKDLRLGPFSRRHART
jgi:hypothetical protein